MSYYGYYDSIYTLRFMRPRKTYLYQNQAGGSMGMEGEMARGRLGWSWYQGYQLWPQENKVGPVSRISIK